VSCKKILIVEDDDSIADFLQIALRSQGFETHWAADGQAALDMFRDVLPDAVLLDLNLPKLEGTEVLRWIRQESQVPVLVVSVRNDEKDKVALLELGADDFITKPFSARELVARVRTNLRRESVETGLSQLGDLTIDWNRAEVFRAEVKVILSRQEFDFLKLLHQNRHRVLSRSFLVERVWGYDFDGDDRVVDTAVKRLRRKIGSRLIETVRGRGYRLQCYED
jgi:two-component system response regulator MtrA